MSVIFPLKHALKCEPLQVICVFGALSEWIFEVTCELCRQTFHHTYFEDLYVLSEFI
jgi:hypothetical protein